MSDFEQRINALDTKLFERINAQLSDFDRRSLLICQLAAREISNPYNYLEIGSYLGGSIQPHLLDDRCVKIYSIDKRPLNQPDERGQTYTYLNNSTARMFELLGAVAPTEKITAIDGDTRTTVSPSQISEKVQVCFIDGEHTDEAVVADFKFCLDALDDNGAIIFHDAPITYNGISECIRILESSARRFRAYSLPDILFVFEIGDFPLHQNSALREALLNNYRSYLSALRFNDHYRRFATKPIFRLYHSIIVKLKGLNRFD
jgi:predicted O-methyltransferase YrrM